MNKQFMIHDLVEIISNIEDNNNKHPAAIPNHSTAERYLRRTSWNPYQAEKLYRKMIHWRKLNEIDSRFSPQEKQNFYKNPLSSAYCHKHTDKLGIPIEIMKISKIDLEGDIEEFIDHFILKEELMFEKHPISDHGMILVYDFSNISVTLQFLFNMVPKITKVSQLVDDYYAGRARKVYMINVPKIFSMGYEMAKVVIPQETIDMTHIYSSDSFNDFTKHIGEHLENSEDFFTEMALDQQKD